MNSFSPGAGGWGDTNRRLTTPRSGSTESTSADPRGGPGHDAAAPSKLSSKPRDGDCSKSTLTATTSAKRWTVSTAYTNCFGIAARSRFNAFSISLVLGGGIAEFGVAELGCSFGQLKSLPPKWPWSRYNAPAQAGNWMNPGRGED